MSAVTIPGVLFFLFYLFPCSPMMRYCAVTSLSVAQLVTALCLPGTTDGGMRSREIKRILLTHTANLTLKTKSLHCSRVAHSSQAASLCLGPAVRAAPSHTGDPHSE